MDEIKSCPSCNQPVEPGTTVCPLCHIIFSKWIERQTRVQPPLSETSDSTPDRPISRGQTSQNVPAHSTFFELGMIAGIYLMSTFLLTVSSTSSTEPSKAEYLTSTLIDNWKITDERATEIEKEVESLSPGQIESELNKIKGIESFRITWSNILMGRAMAGDYRSFLIMVKAKTIPILTDFKDPKDEDFRYSADNPLGMAAIIGSTHLTKKMLELQTSGANPYFFGNIDAALLWAAKNGHADIVNILLEKGADVHFSGKYPIIAYAVENGHYEVTKRLLESRSNPDDGIIMGPRLKLAELLLEKGADPNKRNANSQTPLMVAAQKGESETVKRLIESGALVHAIDQEGNSALHYAVNQNPEDGGMSAKYLIDGGATIDLKNKFGRTPLFDAHKSNNIIAIEKLKNAGANSLHLPIPPRKARYEKSQRAEDEIKGISPINVFKKFLLAKRSARKRNEISHFYPENIEISKMAKEGNLDLDQTHNKYYWDDVTKGFTEPIYDGDQVTFVRIHKTGETQVLMRLEKNVWKIIQANTKYSR